MKRILVAGVGNVFFGDDGFGVEVARKLADEEFPEGVEVADFGIRGVHLAYQLLEGYDLLILIDALSRGEAPGTLFVLEPDADRVEGTVFADAHGMDPETVLGMVRTLGGRVGRVLVVGCEPAEIVERMGLSSVTQRSVEPAVRLVRDILEQEFSSVEEREAKA